MLEPKDKRTKEYKEWKALQPSEGLGDTIEKVLDNPVGKALKKLIFKDGEDCGCEERKKKLNKAFESIENHRKGVAEKGGTWKFPRRAAPPL